MVDNNPPYNKRNIGTGYENMAVEYLLSQGHTIIKRNYRTRFGEIDIISKDNSTIVFTECKYRSNNRYGYAIEAVDVRKQHKISRVLCFFVPGMDTPLFRVVLTVIGIDRNNRITHIKNAFDYR